LGIASGTGTLGQGWKRQLVEPAPEDELHFDGRPKEAPASACETRMMENNYSVQPVKADTNDNIFDLKTDLKK
jgi:hypothetical protein